MLTMFFRTVAAFMTASPTWMLVAAASLVVSSIGCNSKAKPTSENFAKTINAYFLERPDCLFSGIRFPYATSDAQITKQMNSLVKTQLLESSFEYAVHTTRYTVSQAGTRYAPRFCYGHRIVSSIDNFQAPTKGPSGFPETKVSFHYRLEDVPVWAKSQGILDAFPDIAEKINQGGNGDLSLAQTMAGWQVPER
jgi:hypothetical protein